MEFLVATLNFNLKLNVFVRNSKSGARIINLIIETFTTHQQLEATVSEIKNTLDIQGGKDNAVCGSLTKEK